MLDAEIVGSKTSIEAALLSALFSDAVANPHSPIRTAQANKWDGWFAIFISNKAVSVQLVLDIDLTGQFTNKTAPTMISGSREPWLDVSHVWEILIFVVRKPLFSGQKRCSN